MRMKSYLMALLLIVLSIGLSVLAAEYGTRILFPALTPSGQIRFITGTGDEPTLGPKNTQFRQVKNSGDYDVSVQFNMYGLRDNKGLSGAKSSDFFVVGDSLMFGWGVEEGERLSDVLQNLIKRPVYNLAIPADIDGYEKLIEYAKRNGSEVRNIILVISEETNLQDYEYNQTPETHYKNRNYLLLSVKEFLMTRSAFYFLVTSFIHKNPVLKDLAIRYGLIIPNLEGVAQRPYSRQVLVSSADRTAKLAGKYQTIVAVAPSRALWYGEEKDKVVARRIHSEFIQLLHKRNLTVIDFRETFEKDGAPLQYFFKNDGHWNPAGHAASAEAVAKQIISRQ